MDRHKSEGLNGSQNWTIINFLQKNVGNNVFKTEWNLMKVHAKENENMLGLFYLFSGQSNSVKYPCI